MKKSMMRIKILGLCLVSTLFALVLESFLFQKVSSELIYSNAKRESAISLQYIQEDIDLYIEQIKENLSGVYNERQLIQDLNSEKEYGAIKLDDFKSAHDIANTNFGPTDSVQALYVYDRNHRIISTYRHAIPAFFDYPTDIYTINGKDNAEIVKAYVNSDKTSMFVDGYFNETMEKNIVRFVLKIYEKHNYSNLIGYVVCDIDSKVFKNMMSKYVRNSDIFMWLQEYGNSPTVTTGSINEEKEQTLFEELSYKIERKELSKDESFIGSEHVFFQAAQTRNDLRVFSLVPQKLLIENQKRLSFSLISISVIMVLLISFISFWFSKGITKPLEKMMETIKRIRMGETDLRVENPGKDEIGQLGASFNNLLDEMEDLISKEYQTKLLLREAEYKALQAQINPHFLYNTLDTMSSIAAISNCTIVSNLSLSLSSIFRYSLDMKNPLSTVAREILHLKNYLYVMNIRMQEDVRYEFEIDEEVSQNIIPKISIQPIVENALNHGLRNKHGEKTIKITAKAQDNDLLITVIDNGIGMNAEELNEKFRKYDVDEVEAGNSIGLLNINARIKMLFGEKYGIQIESELDHGTSVHLRVPQRVSEEAK